MSSDPELESIDSELEDSSIEADYTIKYGPLSLPGGMVSVKVKDGVPYNIPLEVLIEDSMYFHRALLWRPPGEELDPIDIDISSKDFGLYVSVMYPAVLCKTELTLQQVWPIIHDEGPHVHHPWLLILRLWQLGHRFENYKVMSIAEAELKSKVCDYSATEWQSKYEHRSEATLKKRMLMLQDAFRLCQDKRLPFGRLIVKAASQAPSEVFAACADDLDDEVFKSKVTRAFTLRFVDPASAAKKRRRDERTERERQDKKQKREN